MRTVQSGRRGGGWILERCCTKAGPLFSAGTDVTGMTKSFPFFMIVAGVADYPGSHLRGFELSASLGQDIGGKELKIIVPLSGFRGEGYWCTLWESRSSTINTVISIILGGGE